MHYFSKMHLRKLHLLNFKSWTEAEFDLGPKLNCFVGLNGSGKTNLLDAIHYLCLTKSYFGNRDQRNIRHGSDFFMIEAQVARKEEEEHLHLSLKKGAKKILKRNKKEYEKLSEHIGSFPAVVISPYDRDLIIDSSETRRRFLDNVISQGNAQYLFHLMRYQKALQQRNSLLKFFAANHTFDKEAIDLYDQQLVEHGAYIAEARNAFSRELNPRIQHYYEWLSEGKEQAILEYRSQFNENPLDALRERHEKDRVLQHSSWGVHRDDLRFLMNERLVREYASQGQQKSFLIALKLAQYEFIRDHQQIEPVLLLDDIFDKLDEQRVARLVSLVHDANFGQIFITDTHEDRTGPLLKQIDPEAKIINVSTLNNGG